MKLALTFDDVLLVPQKADLDPTLVSVKTTLGKKIILDIPIISASMDTVTESSMAITLGRLGGLGIIHRNMDEKQQVSEIRKVKAKNLLCGAAISVGPNAVARSKKLIGAGVDVIVIDVAHGHFIKVAETVRQIKRLSRLVTVIGGNVATGKATADLIKAGADAVKVGVGPGSICTTRIIAGVGVPQLTAVMDAVKAAKKTKTPIIADGGIKYSGDIVKALAAGASAVMLGSLLAGTDESPGKKIKTKNGFVKMYRGMGSVDAMIKGSKERYLQSAKKPKELIAEGVVGQVAYKGSVKDVVHQLVGGIHQGLGYCGSKNITELHKKAEFVQITTAGLKESHPHSLQKIQESTNYNSQIFL